LEGRAKKLKQKNKKAWATPPSSEPCVRKCKCFLPGVSVCVCLCVCAYKQAISGSFQMVLCVCVGGFEWQDEAFILAKLQAK